MNGSKGSDSKNHPTVEKGTAAILKVGKVIELEANGMGSLCAFLRMS